MFFLVHYKSKKHVFLSIMKRITEKEHKKYFEKLVEVGVLEKSVDGKFVHVHHEWNKEGSLEKMKNLKVGPNCVWIVGYPKTGSHFVQTILQNIGCKLCIGMKENDIYIEPNPLENQDHGTKAFDLLEKKTKKSFKKPYVLPHTHLPLDAFPKNIPGNKVIFVDRDPRAVIASAYHFFCEKADNKDTVYVEPYVKLFDVKDINHFAELFLSGNFFYGDYFEYNSTWKENFKSLHPEAEILCLSYEFLKGHTVQAVEIIAKFLQIKDFDALEVAEKSSFKKAAKTEVKKERDTDFHQKLFRSGTTQAWRKELDESRIAKYADRAKLYGYNFKKITCFSFVL